VNDLGGELNMQIFKQDSNGGFCRKISSPLQNNYFILNCMSGFTFKNFGCVISFETNCEADTRISRYQETRWKLSIKLKTKRGNEKIPI
jgi:hypothetical protein